MLRHHRFWLRAVRVILRECRTVPIQVWIFPVSSWEDPTATRAPMLLLVLLQITILGPLLRPLHRRPQQHPQPQQQQPPRCHGCINCSKCETWALPMKWRIVRLCSKRTAISIEPWIFYCSATTTIKVNRRPPTTTTTTMSRQHRRTRTMRTTVRRYGYI